jgi:hypothetical protein
MRGLIAALLIVATAAPALAVEPVEEPQFDRHRIQIGFGGGYGKVSVDETGVFAETSSTPNDFTMGMAFVLEYAYRINPDVSVGAFVTGWMGALDGELGNEDWSPSVLGGAFQYRPGGKGFYLKGGFGACYVMASVDDPKSEEPLEDYSDYGFGVVAALGYDVNITPNYAAGPRLEFQAMDVGEGVTAVSSSLLFMFTF